jgi:hypothetical protein
MLFGLNRLALVGLQQTQRSRPNGTLTTADKIQASGGILDTKVTPSQFYATPVQVFSTATMVQSFIND